MKYKLFILLLLVSFSGISQDKKLDSLIDDLNSYKQKDIIRINKLVAICDYYYMSDIDKAIPYYDEAISIAKSLSDYKQVSYLKTKLSKNYVTRGLFTEALEHVQSAVKINDSLDLSLESKIQTLNVLSTVYRGYGDNKKSLDVILDVIAYSEQLPLTKEVPRYYYNAGQTYLQLKNLEKAEEYLLKAMELAKKLKDKRLKIIMTSVLGDFYKNVGKYDEATSMIMQSIPYYKNNKQDRNLASSYRILGDIKSLQGQYLASIPYYENALEIYDKTGNLYYSKITNQNLFIAYSIAKDQKKAQEANRRYNTLKDSLDSKERKTLIAEMNAKFETQELKKQKEIAQLNSAKNKNLFIGSTLIAGLILIASLFYLGRFKARKKAEIVTLELKETQKRLALEKQYRQSELKALKAQMDPHFLFNALNSVQEYIILNQRDLASDYLTKFADLMRQYLHHSSETSISLENEINCLKTYLELEKIRFEDSFKYKISVADNLNIEQFYIPTMIIQPFVENAIKHGLLHKKKNKILKIDLRKQDDCIKCVVEDNGIGRKRSRELQSESKTSHQSFAIKTIENRLELLNFDKNEKIGVEIIDLLDDHRKPAGTQVILTIPYIKNKL